MPETVLGTVVIARHGNRLQFPENPFTYEGRFTQSTPLGEVESQQLGSLLRSIYLNRHSDSHISGIHDDLVNTKQIKVYAKTGGEGNVVFDSAIALLQGLFPPTKRNVVKLANGTTILAPLNGYQYIPVETVEPENDRSLESWTDCPEFKRHIQEFYRSDEFKRKAEESKRILESFKDFVFGRPLKLENAWNLFDFINTQNTYNREFASRLPAHVLANARTLANFHENGIFSDRESSGIGNIAARTLLHLILKSLERINSEHDPLKFSLIETAYPSFISFFHEIEAVRANPTLEAIPNFASTIAIELRKAGHSHDSHPVLRLRFKNGTQAEWETLHAYGNRGDIPLKEFFDRAKGDTIFNNRQWAQVCGVSHDGKDARSTYVTYSEFGMLAIFLLCCMVWFVKRKNPKTAAIQLDEKASE